MISKPIDEITAEDITALCDHGGTYENLTLEFKRELPGRDGRTDPWMVGGAVSNYARDRLFSEVVAFANARGGTLVLGIDQTQDQPPRAQQILPIPRVHDLAARLEEAARACIEPPLASLQIRGIATVGADAGVVIFHTVPSPFGPHRVTNDGHAFIRRGSSSVRMTMREIQDLTLDLARGTDRLDKLFNDRASAFSRWFRYSSLAEQGGLRITAAPLSAMPRSIRILEQTGGVRYSTRYQAQIGKSECQIVLPGGLTSRPILRGCRLLCEDDKYAVQIDILDSGTIDLWMRKSRERDIHFYVGWILGAYVTVLRMADWVRELAAAPEWEFAIELELDGLTGASALPDARGPLAALIIADLDLGQIRETYSLGRLPIRFPRLPSRSRYDEDELPTLSGPT